MEEKLTLPKLKKNYQALENIIFQVFGTGIDA